MFIDNKKSLLTKLTKHLFPKQIKWKFKQEMENILIKNIKYHFHCQKSFEFHEF